ncbi:MAG: arsenic resistance N-acetyltransferase ArsN2 [Pseudomonadota bacterium]
MKIFEPNSAQLVEMLDECGLPIADIGSEKQQHFIACGRHFSPDAVVGLEAHKQYGLLRSLAVRKHARSKGFGRQLVREIEKIAIDREIDTLYLLTTTAANYFKKLGYERVDRAEVPDAIKRTEEFSQLCPDDAEVMKKNLDS